MKLRAAAVLSIAWFCVVALMPAAFAARAYAQRSVLAAFRDVVSDAAKSTVQVYANGRRRPAALGAIVDADGYILSKASELTGKIECKLADGRRLEAKLIGVEKSMDLAMLKVDAKDLPVVQWREGDTPAVGSWLATTGFENSNVSPFPVATGVVSVAPRKIPAPPAAMGVTLDGREDIALVEAVLSGSPADQAGIRAGDVIRKVNDKAVKGRVDLVMTIRNFQPNDKVTLVVERDDQEIAMEVVLGSLAVIARPDGIDRAEFQNHLGGELSERRAGFPTALQHDTVLKPSQCGGPIVDLSGKVVGINIARAGRVESFALPASLIKSVLPDLMSGKLNPNPQSQAVADGTQPVAEEEKKVQ